MLSEPRPLRVALLGAGTVGREVARGLLDRGDRLAAIAGRPIAVAGIAVRDIGRATRRGLPGRLLTDAPDALVGSPDTDLVVELLGGDDPAHRLIAAALGAGKPVVTANKHVIAHHGPALESLARRTGAALRFEAAVGGGTPILGPLATELAANDIRRVRGIVNGTTNFLLTLMAGSGRTFEDALRDAQAAGYAESDPRGDLEGDDAVNKLVILARLAFGSWIGPEAVPRCPPTVRGVGSPGITGVRREEVEGAAALGMAIRLLATASDDDRGGVIASVLPTSVPADGPFGSTGGVTNRIEVEGEPIGLVGIIGPGAGGPETSSAVLADIVAVARDAGSTWGGLPPATGSADAVADPGPEATVRRWFAFVPATERPGRLPDALIGSACAESPDGIAIRTPPMTLERARETIGSFLPSDIDVTLYPCDD